jgi:hypothetical protein
VLRSAARFARGIEMIGRVRGGPGGAGYFSKNQT